MRKPSPLELLATQKAFLSFNIFVVDSDPRRAAQMLCDEHVSKMTTETAQMLSTAHRVLDGVPTQVLTKKGRKKTEYMLPGDRNQINLTSHINHPCNVWLRQTTANYEWLLEHGLELAEEFERRYGKSHKSGRLISEHLMSAPVNLPAGGLTPFHQGMPEIYQDSDAVEAYRKFYVGAKSKFASWKRGVPPPDWYSAALAGCTA